MRGDTLTPNPIRVRTPFQKGNRSWKYIARGNPTVPRAPLVGVYATSRSSHSTLRATRSSITGTVPVRTALRYFSEHLSPQ